MRSDVAPTRCVAVPMVLNNVGLCNPVVQIRSAFEAKVLAERDGADLLARMARGTCALVGNSGHLRMTRFGPSIDKHDVVVCDIYETHRLPFE